MKARTALALALLATLGAAAICALLLSVLVAMLGLYRPGHGMPGMTRPWLELGGVQLSRADVSLLSTSVFVGLLAGYAVYRAWKRSWPR